MWKGIGDGKVIFYRSLSGFSFAILLKSFGIKYDQIELKDNEFDTETILQYLRNNTVKFSNFSYLLF